MKLTQRNVAVTCISSEQLGNKLTNEVNSKKCGSYLYIK